MLGRDDDDERARILAAAIHVVGHRGYRCASVEAIVREAQVSQASFERLFRSRQNCFLVAYDAVIGALLRGAQMAAAGEYGRSARAHAALRFLLERLASDPELARACFLELRRAGRQALAHEDKALACLTEVIGPTASDTPRAGRLTGELLAGGVWETIRATLVRGSPSDLPSLLPELHAWVIHGPPAGAD